MSRPKLPLLVDRLRAFAQDEGIQPDPGWAPWKSGVYAVLDCVYSSQARYASVVLPLLKERFPKNSGLEDRPDLPFSLFLEHVGLKPTPERFEEYAAQVMENRQQISGRLKVEVAWKVCKFFTDERLETRADLLALGDEKLARLVLEKLVPDVRGVGPVLGRYLLLLLGLEQYVKPDTLLSRLIGRIGGWQPILGDKGDMALIHEAVTAVAAELGTTAARLDNALWLYESTGTANLPKPRPAQNPDHPFTPRTLAQLQHLERRRHLLNEAHHAPLAAYVRQLREHVRDRDIPDLDPFGGGVQTRILYLLKAPGPKAAQSRGGSGFVSLDNDDPTAQTLFQLTRQAGVNRDWVLLWNSVPWYVGDEERVRAVLPSELQEGQEYLRQLLALLPELRVVVTLGEAATVAWSRLAPKFPDVMTLNTWQAGGQALNGQPERRAHLLSTLHLAQQVTEHVFDSERPTWVTRRRANV